MIFCRFLVVLRRALEVVSLAPGAICPQGVVGAAARAFDNQQVDVALCQFFAAVLAAQFGQGLGGGYAHGCPPCLVPASSASQRELMPKYSGDSSTPVYG